MKILLDQNAPMNLARHLPEHEVSHATELGWGEIQNGELIKLAQSNGFDLLITADKNIPHQQNPARSTVSQLQLSTNNWPLMIPYIPDIVVAVNNIARGESRAVFCGKFVPRKSKRTSDR